MNDESGHYFYGRILELDGCQSTSDTLSGLYESLNEATEGYIEIKLENHLFIQLPQAYAIRHLPPIEYPPHM